MSTSESRAIGGGGIAHEPDRQTRRRRRWLRFGGAFAATMSSAAILLSGTGVAQAQLPREPMSDGIVIAYPEVNVRPGAPTLGPDMSRVIGTIPYGTDVQIDCVVNGPAVTGPFGTTTLWDRVPGYQGNDPAAWVSDAWLDTGRSDPSVDNSLC
jgi:hypothetical protein